MYNKEYTWQQCTFPEFQTLLLEDVDLIGIIGAEHLSPKIQQELSLKKED